MPLYTFKCPVHGDFDDFRDVKDCNKGKCEKCKRVYGNFGIYVDFTPGWDVGFGKHIETKRERDSLVSERGLRRERIV